MCMFWQGYILTFDITKEQTFATGVQRWRKLLGQVGWLCAMVCVCVHALACGSIDNYLWWQCLGV